MKNKSRSITAVCIAAILWIPVNAWAAGKSTSPSPQPKATASPKMPRPFPFHGMVSAVDQNAKTFTINGKEASRVFKITDNTKVTKAGNAATVADITDRTEISGSYWKHEDGSLEAKAVKIGPVSEKKAKKKEKTGGSESPASSPIASPKP